MDKKPAFTHFLVIATAVGAALLIVFGAIYEASAPAKEDGSMAEESRPRIGRRDAKIEMVLIEDLRCGACCYFTEKIFPDIYEKYIATGRACCIVVPVSFLEGSEPLANAALAVNKIAPERFLAFVHAVFRRFNGIKSDGLEQNGVLEAARSVGGIDIDRLKECVLADCFSKRLEENLEWAKRIMGQKFGTPALYVNGIRTSTRSVALVSDRIEKLEKNQ